MPKIKTIKSLLLDRSTRISSDAYPLGSKALQYSAVLLVLLLTLIASYHYKGSQSLILLYGVLTALVVKTIVSNRHSFFVFFLFSFLTLGCWGKLVLHLLFQTKLIEPTGAFNDSGASWDSALIVLNIAFATLLVCSALLARIPQRSCRALPTPYAPPLLIPLLYLSMIFTVAILIFNYKYSILKIGTTPTLKIGGYVYGLISFMIAWGNVILLATLTYWLINSGRLKPQILFYLLSLEGALASVSMGSRAQMILHTAIPFVVYLTQGKRLGWTLNRAQWTKIVLTSLALFLASILLVSADRINSFAQAKPTATSTITAPPPPKPDPATSVRWQWMFYELGKLIVDRWVGLEGVLTVTSSNDKGPELLSKALKEKPAVGTEAIYQKMAGSQYLAFENFTFMTIPGPIAVLLYSDSYLTLIFGLALIFTICYLLELTAYYLLGNIFTRAAIGVAMAYLVVQTNFPYVLLILFLETLMFLGGLFVLRKFLSIRPTGLA